MPRRRARVLLRRTVNATAAAATATRPVFAPAVPPAHVVDGLGTRSALVATVLAWSVYMCTGAICRCSGGSGVSRPLNIAAGKHPLQLGVDCGERDARRRVDARTAIREPFLVRLQ